MNWFYLMEGILLGICGFLLVFKVSLVKKFLHWIQERELYIIPGVTEIIFGLLTLYFRHQTAFKSFIFIVGLLLFVDGIFYLLATKKLGNTFQWFINLEDSSYRAYSIFIFLMSLGLIASALIPA